MKPLKKQEKGKRLIITGQSGVNKKEYLERVIKQEYLSPEERRKK